MNSIFTKSAAVAFAAVIAVTFTMGSASAAIKGSSHDLGAGGGGLGAGTASNTDEICVFCHTPHGANVESGVDSARLPLWNRTVIDNSAVTRYLMYNTGVVPVQGTGALGGVTLLCLSCHDGVTALGAVLNDTNATNKAAVNVTKITGSALLLDGANGLSNDHPVGMTYAGSANKTGGAQTAYVAIATAELTATFYNTGGPADEVTCASCHEPHNSTGNTAFLRADQDVDSGMCTTCHAK